MSATCGAVSRSARSKVAVRAEDVRHTSELREIRRMERAEQRRVERLLRTVGERRELHGQQHRHGDERKPDDAHRHERTAGACADSVHGRSAATISPTAAATSTKHSSKSDTWLRSSTSAEATTRKSRRDRDRAALERELKQKERRRKQAVAHDEAGVLQSARAAPPNMNSTAASTQAAAGQRARQPIACDREPADQEMRRDQEVEGAQRRRRVEQRPQHEGRREDQRLRVGDARMAAVVIRIPERQLAGMDGECEEAEEGIELVLRVPRDDRVGHDPRLAASSQIAAMARRTSARPWRRLLALARRSRL